MGRLGKLIFDTTVKAVTNAAVRSGAAEKTLDSMLQKLNDIVTPLAKEELIKDDSFENHLIVELDTSGKSEDVYNIFDEEDNQKYTVKRPFLNQKYEIHVFDSKRQKIGIIKEQKPLFKQVDEVEERTCDIELRDKYIGQVRTYKTSSGIIKLSFDYNDFSVNKNFSNTKVEIAKEDEKVCSINYQSAKINSREVYVISYNDKTHEEAFVIFTIAMDKIVN